MRLHRYFGSHADTTLKEKRLLLAKVSEFNDPFEFTHRFSGEYTVDHAEKDFATMSDEDVEAELSKIKNYQLFNDLSSCSPRRLLAEFFVRNGGTPPVDICHGHKLADDFFRVCCFSKTDATSDSEILLWSHYADSHRGIRIEFEIDERLFPLIEVAYSSCRCAIDFSRVHEGNHTRDILSQSMRTKSTAWSYEKEVRLVTNTMFKILVPHDGNYYMPFEPGWVKSVDFGINCNLDTIENVTAILNSEYPHVIMRKAFHHPEDYAIEYRQLQR